MKKFYLFSRRFQGEAYKFYKCCDTFQSMPCTWYTVETPKNAFGYSDTILINGDQAPYTLWRYCPPWILRECKKALVRRGYM